jgi:hypothetical protein
MFACVLVATTCEPPELVAWVPVPSYVAPITSVPAIEGVYVTEQVAVALLPARVQAVSENVPAPPVNQCTVPPGVIATPGDVSVTVAVHVEAEPTWTGVPQVTEVVVCRWLTPICAEPLLAPWAGSPG